MGTINTSGSETGKERPGQAAARGASRPHRDVEQTTPGEPQNEDLVQTPLLLQMSCHNVGLRDRSLLQPQFIPNPPGTVRAAYPTAVPRAEQRSRRRRRGDASLGVFFGGGIFPSAWLTRAQEAGEPLSYREG